MVVVDFALLLTINRESGIESLLYTGTIVLMNPYPDLIKKD